MHELVAPWAAIFDLNTKLLLNTVDGMTEEAAAARPNEHTNSAAFVAGHLVETRAWMGRFLGLDTPPPFGGALEHAAKLADIDRMPTLSDIRPAWAVVSAAVRDRLERLTGEELAAPASQRFPGVPPTWLGSVAFLIQHESYHVGQLGFLRRYTGLPSMSYR